MSIDTEFDFKPINEGLGFHRKIKPLDVENDSDESFSFSTLGPGTLTNAPVAPATKTSSKHNAKSVSDLIAALPPSLDFAIDEMARGASTRSSPLFSSPGRIATPGAPAAASLVSQENSSDVTSSTKRGFLKLPLGRSDYGMKSKAPVASALDENLAKAFPGVFPHLGTLAGQAASSAVRSPATSSAVSAVRASAMSRTMGSERRLASHFASAVLDTLVSVGLGCVLLAIALSITNVNLLAILENTQADREAILALGILFVAGGILYVLAARSFMGATLGEWSYEIRVGNEAARERWFYPALVMWRGLLVAATGFVIFPILSSIVGTDLLKYFTGLELVGLDGDEL